MSRTKTLLPNAVSFATVACVTSVCCALPSAIEFNLEPNGGSDFQQAFRSEGPWGATTLFQGDLLGYRPGGPSRGHGQPSLVSLAGGLRRPEI